MTDILNILNSLSAEKRALLEKKLRGNGSQYNIFPLSFAQQRLWFINQMDTGSTAYNIPTAVELTGKLNAEALEKSINEIIKRHEILRTVFCVFDGAPMQIILPFSPQCLILTDLSHLALSERAETALKFIEEEKKYLFDLTTGPLFKSHLYKISDEKYIFFFLMHHIITDGWSVDIFIRELGILYESFSGNDYPELPPLSIQYSDFSVWQKKWMEGEVKQNQLNYWKAKLSGLPGTLRLLGEMSSRKSAGEECEEKSIHLSAQYLSEVKKLGALEGTTNYMVFLALLYILIYRHTGQNDFSIGTPVANRNRSEIENLIGFFVNTLVLRTTINEETTFLEYLREVKKTAIEAYQNQDLPFDKLVEELYPGRDRTNSPFFRIMYVHGTNLHSGLNLTGLKITPLEIKSQTGKYDLTFSVSEDAGKGFTVTFMYMSGIISGEAVNSLLEHFRVLLDAVILAPSEKLCELPVMARQELDRILYQWNNWAHIKSGAEPFPRTFERQTAVSPDSIAVCANGKHLTFSELNSRSNKLAHFLIRKGIVQESMVGICTGRSVDMIAAIIAVMKAGGTYVPLDPFYPKDRFLYILEDAGIKTLITEEVFLKELPESSCSIICTDKDREEISKESDNNPECEIHMQNAAYVIYTSGSTGKPKGSVIQYNSLYNLHYVLDHIYLSGYSPQKLRVSLNTTIMFDASIIQIMALLSGHSLYIVPEEIRRDMKGLVKFVVANKLDLLDCVTSILKLLIEEKLFESEVKPRIIYTGGEAFDAATWNAVNQIKGTDFYNLYGPTECTVIANICNFSSHIEGPSIGRAIPNVPLYVLDNNLRPVPIGTPGELCIGGDAVGRGYLNRPELTAQKFIPDEFSLEKGGRLYRTGDLVRYNFDGTIDYLGRSDYQVKIRGLRIELGEIESVIRRFPGIKESIVILKESANDKFLLAYAVPKNGIEIKIPEIKKFLRKELPEYMIPSAFIFLNSWPLTPNGKIDKKALPEPSKNSRDDERINISPRTATEEIACGVMAGVLNKKYVGVNENFFEIGGHSLLAAQVIYRLRDIFQIQLQLKEIFDFPTACSLSMRIEQAKVLSAGIVQPPIGRTSREEPLALSFAQERLWFLDQLNPGSTAYNVPEAVRINEKINAEMLEESLNIIIRRHEILRTIYLSQEGKPYQKIITEFNVTMPVIEAGSLNCTEQEMLINEAISMETQKPFLLDRLPLFRALLIKLSDNEFILILTFHHIITDGWSSRALFSELIKYYYSLAKGVPPAVYDLPVQYSDYAAWQRKYFSGENLRRHIEYWTGKLNGSPQLLELPADRPRPDVQSYKGSFLCFKLPGKMSDAVKKLNRNYGVTLFMSLLSIFQVLLKRYSRQEDILIGTPIANRNRTDIEELIGFFVNTLVIRVRVSDQMKFSDLLRQTKETALEAYTYQDLPFEMIIDALHLERSVSYSPLFQVMFSAENMQTDNRFSNNGIVVHEIEIPATSSKYDISLSAVEEPDGLKLAFEYNTDLFEKETIERMFLHYERILESVVSNPEVRIKDIALLSPEEEKEALDCLINERRGTYLNKLSYLLLNEHSTKEVLRIWNRNDKDSDGCVKFFHRLFEDQALRTPERLAVVSEQGSLTFSELNRRANLIAHYLLKKGIGTEDVVGVLLGRNADLIASILAVMKSGSGYLPLDPVYPKGRIEYILKDAGVRLLITEEALMEDSALNACEVICLERDWPEISKGSDANPEVDLSEENIAYVIYTSGSTGKPKGSIVQHGNLYNYYRIIGDTYSRYFREHPVRAVLNTTIMFDASIQQIMFMLYGNELYIPPEDVRRDGLALTEYIISNRIDILDCVPSLLKVFISEGLFDRSTWKPALVIAGGEALDEAIWKKICSIDGTDFFNTYGPTETTVDAAICRIKDNTPKPVIGKPPLNVEIYIMDQRLNLLPIGATGELCIGGISVGRGYLMRPDLTAEKFIPSPFSTTPGRRLYRTGDLARYNIDGTIEFLGRIDNQVKIRGFRIEPGEIEQVILQHGKIKDAAVLLKERKEGSRYLAAYITLRENLDEASYKAQRDEIKEFLRIQLPEYMIPSSIVFLKELPLAPNGKIDRRALPEDIMENNPNEETIPKTEGERILLEVWKEVLGLESISTKDNFFEIGGDSILAIQVVAKARDKGLKIQPLHLFQHQSISQLAIMISNTEADNLNAAEEEDSAGKFELIPVQSSFFEQDLKQRNHWNQSVFFDIAEKAELPALEAAVRTVMAQHDVLRSAFINENGRWLMQINPESETVPFYLIDLSSFDEKDLESQIESGVSDVQSSLDIENGPVIRFAYFKLNENGRDKFLIAAHHLVIDVVSWRILLEDLLRAYSCHKEQKPLLLPAKTTSFKKWSEYLRNYSASEEIRKEADFWMKLPYQKWTPLERDGSKGEYLEKESSEVCSSLDAEKTHSLTRESQKILNAGITEVLLTALTRAYSAWTEKRVLLIDMEGHGRESLNENYDLSRTVGWFTSVYPLLLDLKTSIYPLESLTVIKEQLRNVPNHGIGYGILKYLYDDKTIRDNLSLLPQSEISFNYLGQLNDSAQEEYQLFSPANYNKGPERGQLNSSRYLIDIVCFVAAGTFQIQMRYSPNIFNENTMLRFSRLFVDELAQIIEISKNGYAELTGSDFPLAHLSREKFDKVLNRLNKKNIEGLK